MKPLALIFLSLYLAKFLMEESMKQTKTKQQWQNQLFLKPIQMYLELQTSEEICIKSKIKE